MIPLKAIAQESDFGSESGIKVISPKYKFSLKNTKTQGELAISRLLPFPASLLAKQYEIVSPITKEQGHYQVGEGEPIHSECKSCI
jgi:hypothetical protein